MGRGGHHQHAVRWGRKSAWKCPGNTRTVRVPEALLEQILDLSHQLDEGILASDTKALKEERDHNQNLSREIEGLKKQISNLKTENEKLKFDNDTLKAQSQIKKKPKQIDNGTQITSKGSAIRGIIPNTSSK